MIKYGHKIKEEVKAIQSEISKIYRKPTMRRRKPGLKLMIWSKKKK